MLTTVSIGLPVTPTHSPLRTLSAKAYTLSSTSCTWGTTSIAVDDQAGIPRAPAARCAAPHGPR